MSGGVELERAVDSIRVGYRRRRELGDLDELCASIQRLGLLQPITISPDGTLICGQRRLDAVKRLGWKHVKVWVSSTISTSLEALLAEQHENALRKPLSPTEAATLYAELKRHYAADAARRKQATQFTSQPSPHGRDDGNGDGDGPAELAGPSESASIGCGDARRQAARAITGRSSYTTLERVAEVQRLADDPDSPEELRELARSELAEMDADGKVNGHYLTVKAAAHEQPAELLEAARAAITRATTSASAGQQAPPVKRYGLRAFLSTVQEMDGWWRHYDPGELAAGLSEQQWLKVRSDLEQSIAFIEQIAVARRG